MKSWFELDFWAGGNSGGTGNFIYLDDRDKKLYLNK